MHSISMEKIMEPYINHEGNNKADGIPSISLLGVRVHRVDMEATLNIIRGFISSGNPHIIVTADASAIVIAQNDEDFRGIINNADLVTPDGAGLLKAAKLFGTPLIDRVSGVDIANNVCGMGAEDGFSIFLLGAKPGIAEMAGERLKQQYPGLKIAGTHHGYFTEAENAAIAAKVRDAGAKVLLVGLGIPRQEKWIRDHLSELGVCMAMGVGGSFDVLSGQIRRAPVWMQRHGLEWVYRLAKDPKKITKVATLPRFVMLVLIGRILGGRKG